MTREELQTYIESTYGVKPDCPWKQFRRYQVCRHPSSHKWFALVMDVPADRLNLPGGETVDIVDLKAVPLDVAALTDQRKAFFRRIT